MENQTLEKLVMLLAECADACNRWAMECLQEEDVKKLTHCIQCDLDCAAICQLTAGFISRGSSYMGHIRSECATICRLCAAECDKHAHMEHCKRCAEICRKCADACENGL